VIGKGKNMNQKDSLFSREESEFNPFDTKFESNAKEMIR
jgi:hypothetical protein